MKLTSSGERRLMNSSMLGETQLRLQLIDGLSHVASLCDQGVFPGLKDSLVAMLDQLERCQRALSDFLGE